MKARSKKRAIDAVTPNFAKIIIKNDKEDIIGQMLRGEYVDKRTPEEIKAKREREVEEFHQKFVRLKTELQTGCFSDGTKMDPTNASKTWEAYIRRIKFMIEENEHVELFDEWDKSNFKYITDDVKRYFNESKRRLQTGYWTKDDPMNDVQTTLMQERYNTILKLITELGYTDWLDGWDERNIKNVE